VGKICERGSVILVCKRRDVESGFYFRQGGYVFVVVCLCVCLLATLRKNFRTVSTKFSEKVGNVPMNK